VAGGIPIRQDSVLLVAHIYVSYCSGTSDLPLPPLCNACNSKLVKTVHQLKRENVNVEQKSALLGLITRNLGAQL